MDLAIDKNMIDKDEYPQTAEIERRCVHMLADLWNAPEAANTVGASAIGSSEACMLGGHGGQVALAGQARGRRASRPTGRTWCAGRCRWCGTSSPSTGTSRCARCRCRPGTTRWTPEDMLERVDENTIIVVPTFGVTYTGAYELVQADRRRARPAAGRHRPRRRHPRRRGQRRVPRPVLRARPGVGLPAAAGEVDQHVGPQVRAGPARRRLGRLARRGRAARRPDLPRELPRRRHAGVPDQLLPAGRPDRRPVLRLPAPRPRGLPAGPHGLLRHRPVPRRGDPEARARSSCSATATRRPASRP